MNPLHLEMATVAMQSNMSRQRHLQGRQGSSLRREILPHCGRVTKPGKLDKQLMIFNSVE
jgi:hypothetical protein